MILNRGKGGNRVARDRFSRGSRGFAVVIAGLCAAGLLCAPLTAGAQPAPKGAAKREPKGAKAPEVVQELNAVADAQRALAADISQLRDQLNAVQRGVGEGHDEVRQNRDILQTTLEQVKGMREEVRGLYVESSGLKGDIAQVGKQVEGLEGSLGGFRLNSGILIAVVLVLQLLLVGLMFRGRG